MTNEYGDCEYCGERRDEEGCPACREEMDRQATYWRGLWEAERNHRESVRLAREELDIPEHVDEDDPAFRYAVQRLLK